MSDQIDELVKEIAVKHGIAVSRDDPILVLQTINNRLMVNSSKAQQAQLDQYKKELEGLAVRWGNDAKDKAERVLNAALGASQEAMNTEMKGSVNAAASAVRDEIEAALGGVNRLLADAKRVAMLNVLSACITLAAASVALWVTLR